MSTIPCTYAPSGVLLRELNWSARAKMSVRFLSKSENNSYLVGTGGEVLKNIEGKKFNFKFVSYILSSHFLILTDSYLFSQFEPLTKLEVVALPWWCYYLSAGAVND